MPVIALYDLSPALRLMIMGLIVATGPLVWIWRRNRQASVSRRLQVLTLVTLFLTFDLVVFGAFTRLTDSGLGCPDWPGCYGHASPLGAQLHIDAAQTALPSGPVTHPKAWIEMIHRYLATGVGVMILTLTAASWLERKSAKRRSALHAVSERGGEGSSAGPSQAMPAPSGGSALHAVSERGGGGSSAGPSQAMPAPSGGRALHAVSERGGDISPWLPTFTLLWVCLQGAFGALTVTMKLFPAIVTMHLLGGLVLLALLKVQAVRRAQSDSAYVPVRLSRGMRRFVLATFALLWLQIVLGGWVSTNYAVLACTEFPGCQGSLWPAMDFRQGFTVWRELGAGSNGDNISFQALTAIHYVHRLSAYLVFAALLALAYKLAQVPPLRTQARWLAGLAWLQVATGLGNVLLGWPLFAAVLHTAGAAALVVVLTGIVFCNPAGKRVTQVPAASKSSASRLPA